LVPDMIGTGETGPGNFTGDSFIGDISYNIWFASILINESLAEIRARDVISLSTFLKRHTNSQEIMAVAKGNMSPVLLHAAITDESLARIALVDAYVSYQSVVLNRFYNTGYIQNTKSGVLSKYDLPDLMAGLAPRQLLVATKDKTNDNYFSQGNWKKDVDFIRNVYQQKNALDKLDFRTCDEDCDSKNLLTEWIGKRIF
jgi:hypothetical protein